MPILVIVLLVAAAICFGLTAFGIARKDLTALGLLFWVLSILLPKVIT